MPRPRLAAGWWIATTLVALSLVPAPTAAGTMPAEIMRERFVEDNIFTSTHAPSLRIAVDRRLEYLGSLEFESGAVATERYLFGTTQEQTVERLFVVEVAASEAASETAEASERIEIGGDEYRHTTRVFDHAEQIRREPAAAMARTTAYLEKQGLRLPEHLMSGRLARPAGPDRRREIAIHYFEDLKRADRSIEAVGPGDRFLSGQDQIAARLTERFLASFRVLDR